jgi:hypothetical protein
MNAVSISSFHNYLIRVPLCQLEATWCLSLSPYGDIVAVLMQAQAVMHLLEGSVYLVQ